jgi:ketosteroid isomerase-like protein
MLDTAPPAPTKGRPMTDALLAELAAREEIRQLAVRYADAMDRRDAEALRELFAPGAVVVLPAELGGAGGATEITEPVDLLVPLARFARTRHTLAQQLVDVDSAAATATAVSYGEAHHVSERAGELRDQVLLLRYRDTLARTADGWRFTRRELRIDWTTAQPVGRLGGDPA